MMKAKYYFLLTILLSSLVCISLTSNTANSVYATGISDVSWIAGCFSCHDQTLTLIGMEGFNYSITEEEIHFIEDGGIYPNPLGGTSYTSVGAYATFPTLDGRLHLTFEGRAKAEHPDAVLMGIRIYDPSNMSWLMSSASNPENISSLIGGDYILDTGFVDLTIDITIPGYDELAVFWSYNDFFAADWHQEIWIKNIELNPHDEPIPEDSDWTVGCFSVHDGTLNLIGMDGFNYSITNNEVHLEENGGIYPNPYNITSYTSVGAYATFPTIDGHLYLTFEGRAKAGNLDAVLMRLRIYDPSNMTWLMSSASNPGEIDALESYDRFLDTGYIQMKVDVTVPGLEELTVFWSYDDYFLADWHQEIWIRNVEVNPSIESTLGGKKWTFGCFSCNDQSLNYIGMQGFNYTNAVDEIHIEEIGGIYPNPFDYPEYTSVGAYAIFPTQNGHLNLTIEGRARANHIDAVLLGVRIYNPSDMTWLMSSASHPDNISRITGTTTLDGGYVTLKVDVTIPGYDKLAVYFSYDDYFLSDWHQEIWLQNLVIFQSEEPSPTSTTDNQFRTINFPLSIISIISLISVCYLFSRKYH